ncbi:MAG: hypothetical protein ABIA75_13790 [Candidatus Neomarinimicrobiota bacterium]
MDNPIIYSFLLYLLFITLPLIPALLIYKIFPETQVGATGLLGNLKINATGAFAAYLITSILGFFIITHIQGEITNLRYQTWEVKGVVKYLDKDKNLIPFQDELVALTDINVRPFIKNKTPSFVKFVVTGKGRDIIVTFGQSDRFNTKSFDLSSDTGINVDVSNRCIDLGEIYIEELSSYEEERSVTRGSTAGPPIIPQ